MEGEEGQKEGEKDDYNKELAAAVMKEREEKKVEEEKKREDSLWADFLKDTGMKPKASKPAGSGLASLTSLVSKVTIHWKITLSSGILHHQYLLVIMG